MQVLDGNCADLSFNGGGSIVRAVREESGLSLRDVTERLGWHEAQLTEYETDQRGLTTEALIAIADALNADPEVIMRRILRHLRPRILANPIGAALKPVLDRELRKEKARA